MSLRSTQSWRIYLQRHGIDGSVWEGIIGLATGALLYSTWNLGKALRQKVEFDENEATGPDGLKAKTAILDRKLDTVLAFLDKVAMPINTIYYCFLPSSHTRRHSINCWDVPTGTWTTASLFLKVLIYMKEDIDKPNQVFMELTFLSVKLLLAPQNFWLRIYSITGERYTSQQPRTGSSTS